MQSLIHFLLIHGVRCIYIPTNFVGIYEGLKGTMLEYYILLHNLIDALHLRPCICLPIETIEAAHVLLLLQGVLDRDLGLECAVLYLLLELQVPVVFLPHQPSPMQPIKDLISHTDSIEVSRCTHLGSEWAVLHLRFSLELLELYQVQLLLHSILVETIMDSIVSWWIWSFHTL